MARVKGPLMSLDASGTIAGDTRLRHMRGQVLMYRGGEPGTVRRKAPSKAQRVQRDHYTQAAAKWRGLDAGQRQPFIAQALADPQGRSAWNFFLAYFLTCPACWEGVYIVPPLTEAVELGGSYTPPGLHESLIFALAD